MKGLERAHSSASCFKQQGAALIVIMFIIGLAAVALLIKSYNADSLRVQQEEKTMVALGQAKEALLAWAVSYRDLPGLMPYPNRGTDAAGYADGGSDCFAAATSFNYQFLLGMLPSRDSSDTNCITLSRKGLPDFKDAAGNPLWYAVSRNLVRNYEAPPANPVINPGMVNVDAVKPTPYDGTEVSSAYPWLIVRDMNGNVVSDRVAAIIIAPGPPLAGQSRTNTATSAHFLDQVTVGVTTYSNRDYDQPDEDFVMGGDATLGNTFNDRLVFITIDELIHAVEKRVAAEAKQALRAYQTDLGRFPYAAPLGSSTAQSCLDGLMGGLLPLDTNPSASCTCTSPTECTCGFAEIEKVEFSRNIGSWSGSSGNCTHSGNTCSCVDAGACTALFGLTVFNCDVNGNCTASGLFPNGEFVFSGVFTHSKVNSTSGDCSNACGSNTVTCDGAGNFSSGTCGDPGLAPKVMVSTTAGNNQLMTTASNNFNDNLIVAGMWVSGNGIPKNTVVSAVTNATTLQISRNATATALTEIKFSRLPTWFEANGWQDYVYYAVSRDATPTMMIGGKSGVTALIVTTGRAIDSVPFAESKAAAQNRISCEAEDYLDSIANADGDEFYDATNKARAPNYNDQLFIVAP